MNILEIISGILLLASCVVIILVVMFQEPKSQMSGAVAGGNSDSYFSGNKSRTKAGMLAKLTKIAAFTLFIVTLVVNIANIWM